MVGLPAAVNKTRISHCDKASQSKIVFSVESHTDQQSCAVEKSSELAKEKKGTDEAQALSAAEELKSLEEKVEELSNGNVGLTEKVSEKHRKLEDAEEQLRDVADTNRAFQISVTEQTSKFANTSPENAFWKQMSEEWQNQEMRDADSVVNHKLMEHHREMVIANYVLMHGKIDQLERDLMRKDEDIEQLQRERQDAHREIEQLQGEVQSLRNDEVTREAEIREQAERQARERADEVQNARQEIEQLQG
ncbi:hypothetical protein F66182_17653, partial [Fusarium sp. NRRL 66182]